MEPLFDKLVQRFRFSSVEDVVQRLEVLEKTQIENYSDLLEVREQKQSLDKEVTQLKKEKENAMSSQYIEMTKLIQKKEKELESLQRELFEQQQTIERLQAMQSKYLDLSSGVVSLWIKWSQV